MWIWVILGIILSVALMLPREAAPSNEVKVETVTASISVDEWLEEQLEEWDLQDHLEELVDEDEEELE